MAEVLNLSKATPALNLSKISPTFNVLRGELNWDMHPIHGKSLSDGFDLDIFVFAANAQEKISGVNDVCFFNNKSLFNGGITVPRDNRTGEGDMDEEVTFELSRIPADKVNLDIYVFINEAAKRQQNFGMMANAFFTLKDADTGREIQKYSLSQFTSGDVLHVGRVTKAHGDWQFNPIGEAANSDPNQVIGAYL